MTTSSKSVIAPPARALNRVKRTMLITDLGFLTYWVLVSVGVITVGTSKILSDWNWSFFILDMIAIGTGLVSVLLPRTPTLPLMVISLSLTSAAGLMALNFYALRGEFDPQWWIPNLWLFLFPVAGLIVVTRQMSRQNLQGLPRRRPTPHDEQSTSPSDN